MLARCSRCTWGATPCTSRPAVPAAARGRWRMGTPEVERMVGLETTASTLARSRSSPELHPQMRCMHPARTGAAPRQLVKDRSHCRRCGGGARPKAARWVPARMPLRRRKNKEARILSESGPLGRGDAGCAYTFPAPGLALRSSSLFVHGWLPGRCEDKEAQASFRTQPMKATRACEPWPAARVMLVVGRRLAFTVGP